MPVHASRADAAGGAWSRGCAPSPFGAEAAAETSGAAGLMRAMLDHLQLGLMAVAADGSVRCANRAALQACMQLAELRVDRGRLVAALQPGPQALGRAIAAARAGRWTLVSLGDAGEPTLVAAMPLGPRDGADGFTVLLLFGAPRDAYTLAMQLFARDAGLTAAETRVLHALADGHAPRQIAQQHEVALSTVRSQVGSIRAKIGARSLTQVARRVGRLPPVMPAAALAGS
jgi:DNA-binding CsgD family transcriptional regulator